MEKKKITFKLRERHLCRAEGHCFVDNVAIEYTDLVVISVVDGVAYAPIMGGRSAAMLAALAETPEELKKRQDVVLYYVDNLKEE